MPPVPSSFVTIFQKLTGFFPQPFSYHSSVLRFFSSAAAFFFSLALIFLSFLSFVPAFVFSPFFYPLPASSASFSHLFSFQFLSSAAFLASSSACFFFPASFPSTFLSASVLRASFSSFAVQLSFFSKSLLDPGRPGSGGILSELSCAAVLRALIAAYSSAALRAAAASASCCIFRTQRHGPPVQQLPFHGHVSVHPANVFSFNVHSQRLQGNHLPSCAGWAILGWVSVLGIG